MKLVHEKQLHIQPRIEELGLHQIVRYQSKSSVLPLQSWTSRAKKNIWDHDRTYLMEKYRIELAHQNNLDLNFFGNIPETVDLLTPTLSKIFPPVKR